MNPQEPHEEPGNDDAAQPAITPITELLRRAEAGDLGARDHAYGQLHDELRRLAKAVRGRQSPDHSLQTTAVLNEACLRLLKPAERTFESKNHFMGFAARAMRSVLADHARGRGRDKRKAEGGQIPLDHLATAVEDKTGDLIQVDEIMTRLRQVDAEAEAVFNLRMIGGFGEAETAEITGLSPRTVNRRLKLARLWLAKELR